MKWGDKCPAHESELLDEDDLKRAGEHRQQRERPDLRGLVWHRVGQCVAGSGREQSGERSGERSARKVAGQAGQEGAGQVHSSMADSTTNLGQHEP